MILICLPWDHGSSETDVFLDNFTQQDAMLRQMIDAISLRTAIARISGQDEYAAKVCSGFNLRLWLKGA